MTYPLGPLGTWGLRVIPIATQGPFPVITHRIKCSNNGGLVSSVHGRGN